MYIVLVIAFLSTLLFINIMFAEHITAKVNLYKTDDDSELDKNRARLKIALIIIMALFWAAYIHYN